MLQLKSIFLFLSIVLLSTSNEVAISWRNNYKLSWEHFKGQPQKNTDAVAVTASGITFSYSLKHRNSEVIDFTANVEAHFYPEKSWYIKERANQYILAHEQLHFDITELHVRKLRHQISQVKINNFLKKTLDRLHQNSNEELAKMQKLYDTESHNSINTEAQTKWQKFVAKELEKYEAYKSAD